MATTIKYKWELRKGSKKEVCPRCGQKRFVPYVSAADGKTLAGAMFGRCDREQNCGYIAYPTKDVPVIDVPAVVRPIQTKTPLRFSRYAVVTNIHSPLFSYVAHLLGDVHALRIWDRYKIGAEGKSADNGLQDDKARTIFWQIAADGSVRTGKSIPYGKDGHRIKTDAMPANWMHTSPRYRSMREGDTLQQCYFGEHLLTQFPDRPVCIVESEKTAAIMSEVSHGWVWLASGGSGGLKNEEKNAVLKGRDVTLLPDHGMYWKWSQIARDNGWKIEDYVERFPVFEGCDVLDLLDAGALGEDLLYKFKDK